MLFSDKVFYKDLAYLIGLAAASVQLIIISPLFRHKRLQQKNWLLTGKIDFCSIKPAIYDIGFGLCD